MKRAVIYARYSSSGQKEQSIEVQLDECQKYCDSNDMIVVDTYIDRGFSGTNSNRPSFKKMIDDSFEDKFDFVLVYNFDRFAREEYDDMHFERILLQNGVIRLSVTESLPDDEETASIIKAITRWKNAGFSKRLSKRVKDAFNKNVEKGLMLGGRVTWGYKLVDGRYIIDEDKAYYVRKIFEDYNNGISIPEIVSDLENKLILTNYGNTFKLNTIVNILQNKRYIGIFTHLDTEYEEFIPPIINRDLFDSIQRKFAMHTKRRKTANAPTFLLTGKLYCGLCEEPMSGTSGTSRNGSMYHYYACNNGKRKHNCLKKKIKKETLEQIVSNYIRDEILSSQNLPLIINEILNEASKIDTNKKNDAKIFQKEISRLDKEIKNLLNAIKKGIYTDSIQQELTNLELQKETVDKQLLALNLTVNKTYDKDKVAFFFSNLKSISEETEFQKILIDDFLNDIKLYDDELYISITTKKGQFIKIDLSIIQTKSSLDILIGRPSWI